MACSSADKDPVKEAEDVLRHGRKGVAFAEAKLEVHQGESTHVEYFRGKDLVRWIEANPGKLNGVLNKPGKTGEEQAAELVRIFLTRGVVARTERKYKRPKPGRTRLVKYPRTLCLVPEQQWDPAAFYYWKRDRGTSMWYWLATILVPVVVILACLFPLAPWWLRVAVIYSLMGLLVAILGVVALRYVCFGAVWALTGHSFWIMPNLLSDQVGLADAFWPLVSFMKGKGLLDQWQARLVTFAVMLGVLWVLSSHSPDLTHLTDDLGKAHDSFVQYMDTMYARDKSFLADSSGGPGGAPGAAGAGSYSGPKFDSTKQRPGAGGPATSAPKPEPEVPPFPDFADEEL